jgi:hypothetical protein
MNRLTPEEREILRKEGLYDPKLEPSERFERENEYRIAARMDRIAISILAPIVIIVFGLMIYSDYLIDTVYEMSPEEAIAYIEEYKIRSILSGIHRGAEEMKKYLFPISLNPEANIGNPDDLPDGKPAETATVAIVGVGKLEMSWAEATKIPERDINRFRKFIKSLYIKSFEPNYFLYNTIKNNPAEATTLTNQFFEDHETLGWGK